MFALARRQHLLRVVLVLAAADWVLAASLTVADVNRPVAVPLLVTAAGTVLLCQASRLLHVARAGEQPGVAAVAIEVRVEHRDQSAYRPRA